ncbi:MAG: DUF3160 domain-containing protein [Armatimonadetes bacterium]|nr:DUF3160 domain-containing protein [Armatimonadota bacterium]
MKRLMPIGCVLLCLCARMAASDYPTPANIADLRARYPLDEAACTVLRERGFVVLGDRSIRGLHEAYPRDPQDFYVFVTTDALLQLWHDLCLETLKASEQRGMAPNLKLAVSALTRACLAEHDRTRETASQRALSDAALVLCVADRLLGGNVKPPGALRAQVETLVAKVMAHRDVETYPGDDFTQYTVRGHYASSEELARYFRGSMWLSRRIMSVRPERGVRDPDEPLRRAVALAHILRSVPDSRQRMTNVNAARLAIAGISNAISVEQCLTALDQTLGRGWTLANALGQNNLARIRSELGKPAYPAAQVRTGSAWPGAFPDRVIALVPDHAVPDSILFRSATFDAIPDRSLPSGLDVAAALGHRVAEEELRRTEPQADAVLRAVERHRPIMRDDGRTIYRGWLGALRTLSVTDDRAPDFMQTRGWAYEKTNTCLSGWAQLRHASILYAAHSYATMGMSDETPRGWVEPYPAFYRAMADLSERTARIMRRIGGLDADHEELLTVYAAKCRELALFSEAELQGTLTREQGETIRRFGAWLTRFPFRSKPVIADVATGSGREVLHAAVGDMNPIVVMPDRRSAVGYVGWVSSYYEVTRPTTERLTDAAWQAMLDSPSMIPDRPAWSENFVHVDRGPRWEARAPLRQAEELFFTGRADEAIALLRAAIERSPHTEAATEFRYRIGEHYRRKRQFDKAEAEWAACLQMHGGQAWDRALKGLEDIRQEREADQLWLNAARANVTRLKALLPTLRGLVSPTERARMEREALVLALSGHLKSWYAEDAPTLSDVLRVCRDPVAREALEWYGLCHYAEPFEDRHDRVGLSPYLERCVRFIKTARSPALRAAVYVRAIDLGHMHDKPIEAARILAQCAAANLVREDSTDALALVLKVSKAESLLGDRVEDLSSRAAWAAEHLSEELWHAGRIHEADRVLAIAPKTGGYGDPNRRRAMYVHYRDYGRAPLAMFARADRDYGQGHAEEFVAIKARFPDARIAPLALARAERLLGANPETRQRATELRGLVMHRYPNSAVALLYRADAALEGDRLEEAERLYKEIERRTKDKSEEYEFVRDWVGGNRMYLLNDVRDLKQLLEPVFRPAGREDMLKASVLIEARHRGYRILPEMVPELAAEVRLAYLRHRGHSFVVGDFLKYHPDHPAAEEAWGALSKSYAPVDSRDPLGSLTWLVDLVNREPPYRFRTDAQTALERALCLDSHPGTVSVCRAIRERCPGMRAAAVAGVIEARTLIIENRPEQAPAVLAAIATEPAMDDALRARAGALRRCAEQTIEAKKTAPWVPIRTYKEAPPEYVALPLEDAASFPTDDLSVLTRPRIDGQPRTVAHRGVLYCTWESGMVLALDTATGAHLGVAMSPRPYPQRIVADDEGVRVTDHEGNTVVFRLLRSDARLP